MTKIVRDTHWEFVKKLPNTLFNDVRKIINDQMGVIFEGYTPQK